MELIPIEDRVVIEELEVSDETSGGVILPDLAEDTVLKGKIVATGTGLKSLIDGNLMPNICKEGDIVFFPKSFAKKLPEIGGKDYYCIKEREMYAIIKESK